MYTTKENAREIGQAYNWLIMQNLHIDQDKAICSHLEISVWICACMNLRSPVFVSNGREFNFKNQCNPTLI